MKRDVEMEIRREKASEIHQIMEIHQQAFNGPDEARIVERLRNNNHLSISLVCEIEGRVAGHIAYSSIGNEKNDIIGIGLAPVGVLPAYQNKGVGSELIKQGNIKAFDMGYGKIFVLGDPRYYSRFDFLLAREFNYYCGYDPSGDHFMVQGELVKEPEKTMVYYRKEFSGE